MNINIQIYFSYFIDILPIMIYNIHMITKTLSNKLRNGCFQMTHTTNVEQFINEHATLSNDELKSLYAHLHAFADECDVDEQHNIAEYFKTQCDMILSILLQRFDNDFESFLTFLQFEN